MILGILAEGGPAAERSLVTRPAPRLGPGPEPRACPGGARTPGTGPGQCSQEPRDPFCRPPAPVPIPGPVPGSYSRSPVAVPSRLPWQRTRKRRARRSPPAPPFGIPAPASRPHFRPVRPCATSGGAPPPGLRRCQGNGALWGRGGAPAGPCGAGGFGGSGPARAGVFSSRRALLRAPRPQRGRRRVFVRVGIQQSAQCGNKCLGAGCLRPRVYKSRVL